MQATCMSTQSDNALPAREKEKPESLALLEAIRHYARGLDEREREMRRAGRTLNILLLLLFTVLLAGLSAAYILQHSKGH